MAHMNQIKKAAIAAELKKVVPADWKYSLSVRHHSTIVMKIKSAPVNLLSYFDQSFYFRHDTATYLDVNVYHFKRRIQEESMRETFIKIVDALNTGNYDRSDLMTDYHDCGHYVELFIGSYDQPFVCTAELEAA